MDLDKIDKYIDSNSKICNILHCKIFNKYPSKPQALAMEENEYPKLICRLKKDSFDGCKKILFNDI